MDSMSFVLDQKPIFSDSDGNTTNNTAVQTGQESYSPPDGRCKNPSESVFSPLAAPFQRRGGDDLLTLLAQQEPRAADPAPSTSDADMLNYRVNGTDFLFDDHNPSNLFMGESRPESVASSQSAFWTDRSSAGAGVPAARSNEMIDTFDFLLKSLSSANNYVSMLTREQLSVLRSIRPGLLYEFLTEVAKVRGDRRMRRALPNECAFCKNNGENEECYSSHALKDWRGRVLCPVLRAFRCPRCGATGDRAHTIKYCPESTDSGSERGPGMASRRRMQASSLLLGGAALGGSPAGMRTPQPASATACPATPAASPSPASAAFSNASLWSTFGMN